MKSRSITFVAGGAIAALIAAGSLWWTSPAKSVPLSDVSHIHGNAVDPMDSARLYLATHYGVWRTSSDGTAEQISENRNDYMGFTPHPTKPGTFFGSGHPATGGNAGFIISRDAAKTWTQLSPGVNGPVDFHAIHVSANNPDVIYGLYGGIQVSRDGGKTWKIAGPAPAGIFDIAASAADPDTVYAATRNGLMFSRDGAKTWQATGPKGPAASMVEVAPDGSIYVFVVGSGLLRSPGSPLNWKPISNDFGDRILLHLAAEPADPARLFAVTQESEILVSADGGKNWRALHS